MTKNQAHNEDKSICEFYRHETMQDLLQVKIKNVIKYC